MPKIFISYRREDSNYLSGIIATRLTSVFGKGSIVLDVDNIPPGQDFRDYIKCELETCDLLVAVIGKNWLKVRDEGGRPRLENPSDWVRLELEAALGRESKIPVIPVLLDNVPPPKAEQLPATLRELAYRQAFSVRPPSDFDQDVEKLIRKIKSQEKARKRASILAPKQNGQKKRAWSRQSLVFAIVAVVASLVAIIFRWDVIDPILKKGASTIAKDPPAPAIGNSPAMTATTNSPTVTASANNVAATERFGGVEIGAKGIKLAAVEVGGRQASPTLRVLAVDRQTLDTQTIEVPIRRLNRKSFWTYSIDDVAAVVKSDVDLLESKLAVPKHNIQVVASSGVPFALNFADLANAVATRSGKTVVRINALEEAALQAVAVVPADLRTQVLLIDVGSGNTKGGAFIDDSGNPERFAVLEVPYGTVTLRNAIKERAKEGMSPAAAAHELVGTRLQQLLAEKPVLAKREKIILSGGAAWALVTILKPEAALDRLPKVTADEIRRYAELVNRSPGAYPDVDFNRVSEPNARKMALADYNRIRGTGGGSTIFTPEDLQSGAALLYELSASLDFANHSVHFDRNAVRDSITARITPEKWRPLLPAALDGNLNLRQ
jgi:TIR domain